jgi:hypothetical protein
MARARRVRRASLALLALRRDGRARRIWIGSVILYTTMLGLAGNLDDAIGLVI